MGCSIEFPFTHKKCAPERMNHFHFQHLLIDPDRSDNVSSLRLDFKMLNQAFNSCTLSEKDGKTLSFFSSSSVNIIERETSLWPIETMVTAQIHPRWHYTTLYIKMHQSTNAGTLVALATAKMINIYLCAGKRFAALKKYFHLRSQITDLHFVKCFVF